MNPLKLSQYIKVLNKIKKEHGDLPMIYSCDEEGNSFSPLYFAPSAGKLTGRFDFDNSVTKTEINCVCIN